MPHRRTLPAAPFWAMLAAIWALLLLGAAPPVQADLLCGAAGHHAPGHGDCLACCPCTLSAPLGAIAPTTPGMPVPRGAIFVAWQDPHGAVPVVPPPPIARARAPPVPA